VATINHETKAHDRLDLEILVNRGSNQLATYLQFPVLPGSIMNLGGVRNFLVVNVIVTFIS
jgi:hypothetical protein